jgi:hypothetical protein
MFNFGAPEKSLVDHDFDLIELIDESQILSNVVFKLQLLLGHLISKFCILLSSPRYIFTYLVYIHMPTIRTVAASFEAYINLAPGMR